MSNIDNTLAERGGRYGSFVGHAEITQHLKRVMQEYHKKAPLIGGETHLVRAWDCLTDSQREALEMIAHKIGRILNGDPCYDDSWVDIAGYAQLVAKELKGEIV